MKKIVRLTESELKNIVEASVRRAIKEGATNEGTVGDIAKGVAIGLPLTFGTVAGNEYLHKDDPEINPQQKRINTDIKNGMGQHVLEPGGEADDLPADTINFDDARRGLQVNSRMIKGAVIESIKKLMNGEL